MIFKMLSETVIHDAPSDTKTSIKTEVFNQLYPFVSLVVRKHGIYVSPKLHKLKPVSP
jgi:hypothetical protein